MLDIDKALFLLLNGDGGIWWDNLMWLFSKTWCWFPVDAILLWTLLKRFQARQLVWVLLGFGLVVLFADQASSGILKEWVHRLRPSREPELEGLVHLVKDGNGNYYIGGMFGFVSSHAANYAGVAALYLLIMKPLNGTIYFLLFLWVLVISYSRIYLGVHYPGDVLGGWTVGVAAAFIVHYILSKISLKPMVA